MDTIIILFEILLISWCFAFLFFIINKKKEKNFYLYLFVSVLGALLVNFVLTSLIPFWNSFVFFVLGAFLFSLIWYFIDCE